MSDIREADTWLENNPICDADDLNKRERELVQAAWQAALSANGGEAVGEIVSIDGDNYISMEDDTLRELLPGRKLYTHPAPPSVAVPEVTAAEGLISIVEGTQGIEHGTWRDDNGVRLKDTKEWVQFYLSVRNSGTQQTLDSEKLATDALTAAPSPDHIPDAGKVVASSWKSAKTGQHWPHIGDKYLIKLNGVLQHEIYEFDQGDDGMGSGEYFWDREDLDEAAPFNPEKDEWLPIDEAGTATPSVPENEVKARAVEALTRVLAGHFEGRSQSEFEGHAIAEHIEHEGYALSARLRTAGDEGEGV